MYFNDLMDYLGDFNNPDQKDYPGETNDIEIVSNILDIELIQTQQQYAILDAYSPHNKFVCDLTKPDSYDYECYSWATPGFIMPYFKLSTFMRILAFNNFMRRNNEPAVLGLYIWVFKNCIKAIEAERLEQISFAQKSKTSNIEIHKGVFIDPKDMKDVEFYKERLNRMPNYG